MAHRAIVQLSEAVANQIAAGEVVERPASVVKELVENAIDAAATHITVRVEGGGMAAIEVTDNGTGIPAEQVALAFGRHATSKIRSADDLFAVASLGFRGEALPSIASVAHVTLRTKVADARAGTEIRVEGGRRTALVPVGTPVGTTVRVASLFYNTPARRKFLKTEAGERRAVAELLSKLALAHPSICFVLEAEGRELLRTPGDGDLRAAYAAVYDHRVARRLIGLEREAPFGNVGGYVAPPEDAKGNRQHLFVFVNGRWVLSRALAVAVERGYGSLLPSRRFPAGVVQLQVDPTLLDVNVHPAKIEVRFRDEREVFGAVMNAVKESLLRANLIPSLAPAHSRPGDSRPATSDLFRDRTPPPPSPQDPTPSITWSAGPAGPPSKSPKVESVEGPAPVAAAYELVDEATGEVRERQAPPSMAARAARSRGPGEHWHDPLRTTDPNERLPEGAPDAEAARRVLKEGKVAGQVLRTFMLLPVPWGLWLIDQHVAHERILFERVLATAASPPDVQQLLIPESVELPLEAAAQVDELIEPLQVLGFEVERFGGRTVLVRAVPTDVAARGDIVSAVVEEMAAIWSDSGAADRLERTAAMIACKAAVKAGDVLPHEVMQSLLARLADVENPFACPHGRPIVVELGQAELERRFGRR